MSQTGLGVALKMLREKRTLSLREVGELSKIDHAYVHRLETGEKTNPSQDLVDKLLKVLKPSERDITFVKWLVDHADTDPDLVEFAINDRSDLPRANSSLRYRNKTVSSASGTNKYKGKILLDSTVFKVLYA